MTASKIFFYFNLSFIGGIFISSFFFFWQPALFAILIAAIILISIFWKYKTLAVLGFCVLFLILGIWRYQSSDLRIMNNELRILKGKEENIILSGVISQEPDLREKSQKIIIKTEGKDKILITTWRYPEYKYGDNIKITGKLESPPIFSEFNYRDYLKKDGIYFQISWPKIELLDRNQGNFVYAKILHFKERLRTSIYRNLSPPQSAILAAMILGDKRQMPDDLKSKLNIAGLRHITAVSGLHVTVLTAISMTILIGLGLWRQQAFWIAIILIFLFVVMTGFQPSALRAGLMGGLFLLAQYSGRQNFSFRTLFFVAVLMLLQNPLLLKYDVGFQLSFLAMLGIITLLPSFQQWLKFISWQSVKSILSMTFSAYIFTLPILIYNFGYVSLISPITNLLVVPFLYPIMLFGFLFGLTGIVFPALGWILSWLSWLLLTYLIAVVDFSSRLPFVYLSLQNLHWIWLLLSYLVLGIVAYRLQERQRLKFLQY